MRKIKGKIRSGNGRWEKEADLKKDQIERILMYGIAAKDSSGHYESIHIRLPGKYEGMAKTLAKRFSQNSCINRSIFTIGLLVSFRFLDDLKYAKKIEEYLDSLNISSQLCVWENTKKEYDEGLSRLIKALSEENVLSTKMQIVQEIRKLNKSFEKVKEHFVNDVELRKQKHGDIKHGTTV
jgi:hypothetical protein